MTAHNVHRPSHSTSQLSSLAELPAVLVQKTCLHKMLVHKSYLHKNQSSPYSISAQARTHWGVLKIQEKIVLLIRTLIEGMMILFQRRHMSAHLVHFWTFAVKVLNVAIFLVDFV